MFKSIFRTATLRQSSITFTSTIVNGALGAFFYILLARFLGPSEFGLIVLTITVMTLVADVLDLGVNTGLVRFIPHYLPSHKEEAFRFLKLGLEIKTLIGIAVFLIGIMIAPAIATLIFNKEEIITPLRIGFLGVCGAMLFSYTVSSLQSFQKFIYWGLLQIFTNFLRVAVIIVLFILQALSVSSGLITYIALPFLGFFLGLLLLPTRSFLKVENEQKVLKQFFQFNKWVALFTILAAFSSRLDTFLSAKLLSTFELGIYSAANQLVTVVPQIVGSIGAVAAPKFASFTNKHTMLVYFKKLQVLVVALAGLGLLIIPVSFYLIPLIYGNVYQGVTLVFIILLLAMLIFLISLPTHISILYFFSKPQIFVLIALGHLMIMGVGGYLLISLYGIVGTAVAVFLGMLFGLLAPLFWFLKQVLR